jgi:hypothetical protein
MAVPWLKSIRSLADHGVMARIQSLLARRGTAPDTAITMTNQVFAELLRVEHATLVAVIRGEGYLTLWQAAE